MTTLPQTTPMRLPRPAGSGQITIPGAPAGGALGQPAAGAGMFQMSASDVWRVFRTNWWLIVLFMVVFGVAGFFVNRYLAKRYPKFEASALVKVQLAEEMFRQGAEDISAQPQAVELEQKTQVRGLMQPGLMLTVLRDSDKIRQTEWFKKFENAEAAKEDLMENFSATPVQQSRLISVKMTDRIPRDARTVVEEIVNQYIRDQQTVAANQWSDKARDLEEQLAGYEREYKKVTAELTDKSTKLASDNLFQLYSSLESKRYEQSRIMDALTVAEKEYAAAESEYTKLEQVINSGEVPAEVEAKILDSRAIGDYQVQLDTLDTQISQSPGSNSPQRQSLEKRRQSIEQKINDTREALRDTYINDMKSKLMTKRDAAKTAYETNLSKHKENDTKLREMMAAAAQFKLLEDTERTLKEKIDQVEGELEKIQHRRLPSKWAPVAWFTMPPTPETAVFPKLPITLGVAVALGLTLSVSIAFLRELTDTSVRSPRDIARVGNLNLLGMIPHEQDDPQATGARLPLVIFDAPHSMAAEEFRKLRTRLQHAASLDSTRSILVSSANPGDGKTTVACNLAAGLALNGRRILLVDANFRRPDIHNLFEVANEKGFSDALNDLSTFDTLVRDTPVQNLYVMPTGPKPVNATELLESQLLIDFIERALEDYDHVIFDSGPLLLASETMALAPRVDGVVSVVRARTNSRGVLGRMRDMLRQVKAEHLGVVLNAVRSQGGGYYGRSIVDYYKYQNGAVSGRH